MRNRYLLLFDLFSIVIAVLGAFILRLDWFFSRSPDFTRAFLLCVVAALAVKPPVLLAFGMYHRYWRYAGTRELLLIAMAGSAASLALAAVVSAALLTGLVDALSVPRSVLAIDWLLTLALLGGSRVSVRLLAEAFRRTPATDQKAERRVLVVGAGDAGALVVREMQKNPHLGMRPVGFLDDQPGKRGKRIHQVPVLGGLDELGDVAAARRVEEVVIAMPRAHGRVIRQVVDACRAAGLTSRVVPGLFELLEGGLSMSRLRQVEVTDLLRREQVAPSDDGERYLAGRLVLVTGAGGSIGSEVCRQLIRAHVGGLMLLGHGENSIFDAMTRLRELAPDLPLHPVIADIRDERRLHDVLMRFRPAAVFHAAAHKHVPLMEAHPAEAVLNNVIGTRSVVRAALAAGTDRFVLVSTDKAVLPTSVMGATKRVAELVVQDAARVHGRRFAAVRFGNVLGSRGSVVPFFKRQIEAGGPITVTHPDMRRFFMTIPEAAYLVVKAGGMTAGGELFVLNMGEPVRIVDLAQDLIRLSGLDPEDVPIRFIGLRPGEKLEEALWEPGSTVTLADGADIYLVEERADTPRGPALAAAVDELFGAAIGDDADEVRRLLREIVGTFVPGPAVGDPAR